MSVLKLNASRDVCAGLDLAELNKEWKTIVSLSHTHKHTHTHMHAYLQDH